MRKEGISIFYFVVFCIKLLQKFGSFFRFDHKENNFNKIKTHRLTSSTFITELFLCLNIYFFLLYIALVYLKIKFVSLFLGWIIAILKSDNREPVPHAGTNIYIQQTSSDVILPQDLPQMDAVNVRFFVCSSAAHSNPYQTLILQIIDHHKCVEDISKLQLVTRYAMESDLMKISGWTGTFLLRSTLTLCLILVVDMYYTVNFSATN